MATSRARHRAPVAPFAWASRALLTAATVPVGALAGCVVAVVSSSAERPEIGVASLAVAGVPLGLHGWRTRRAGRPSVRGRHVAGIDQIWPDAELVEAPLDAQPEARQPLRASLALVLAHVAPAVGSRALAAPRSLRAAEAPVTPERDAEIAHLQEIWDAGTGPDTGAVVAVAGHRVHAA
jgi:hypothetical protein